MASHGAYVLTTCLLAASFWMTAATASSTVVRREDRHGALALDAADSLPLSKNGHVSMAVTAKGHQVIDTKSHVKKAKGACDCSVSGQPDCYKFQMKSIEQGKCLQLDGTAFSTQDCADSMPNQKFCANGVSAEDDLKTASTTDGISLVGPTTKSLCFSSVTDAVTANDACAADDVKKMQIVPSGQGCFRIKADPDGSAGCLTTYMSALPSMCDADTSLWTYSSSQTACPAATEASKASTDGIDTTEEAAPEVGGASGAIAAGVSTDVEKVETAPDGTITTTGTNGTATVAGSTGTGGGTAATGATGATGTAAGTAASAAKPAPGPAIMGYKFWLKSINTGLCLFLDDDLHTFQQATCNKADPKQEFIAHGYKAPGLAAEDLIAEDVSMRNNAKMMCFDGSDQVMAEDNTCKKNWKGIELEPATGACFKIKWNQIADCDTLVPADGATATCSGLVASDTCMGLTTGAAGQNLMATPELCGAMGGNAALWTSDIAITTCA